ncbi:MAG: TetR/AcrR family transcriptional regulator [Pseudonocardia sp.]
MQNDRETKRDRTRRAVLETAARLLVKDAGTSLAEIAAAAGVSRTTVHRHFPTQQALLHALALKAVGGLSTALAECRLEDGSASQVLQRVADALVPMADELRFLDVGAAGWELPDLLERWYSVTAVLEVLIERGKAEGDLRPELPTAWIADVFAAAMWAAGDSVADGRLAARDAPRLVIDVLLRGAGTAPAGQRPTAGTGEGFGSVSGVDGPL